MRFNMWRRWLNWLGKSAKRIPYRRPVDHARVQLTLEVLEDRQLLALVIVPTFASNITSDVNAATIEGTINMAIAAYEASFTDSITVNITFQEGGGLGGSSTAVNSVTYPAYRAALVTHATTADDTAALASMAAGVNNPVNNTGNVELRTATIRALGLSGGAVASDSTITLNTSLMNLDRTSVQDPTKYDMLAVTCHEIDEALGFGSALNGLNNGQAAPSLIEAEDLFRYDQTGARSYNTTVTTQAFFSIDGGSTKLARFNQTQGGDFSDWYSVTPPPIPQIQDAFGTPGATPNLGVELRRLDVIGFTRVPTAAPVVTPPPDQVDNPGLPTAIDLGSFTGGLGPWTVDVNWGDASAHTIFVVGSTGALGTRSHTYASGTFVPKVTVTDFVNNSGFATFNVIDGTTAISLDGSNNLVVQDIAPGGKDDNLTIQADTAHSQYIISDPSVFSILALRSAVPGATFSVDRHTAFVPFADVTGGSINVNTLGGDDRLFIDNSLGNFTKTFNYDGGTGTNTLAAPNRTNAWNITANNTGNITGLATFINVQNLIGGSGNDAFKFSDNVGVSGAVLGGGGTNTLDYSLYTAAHPITVNLAAGSATNIAGGFANIQALIGGAGADTLIGGNASNTWNITAANAGNINGAFTFSSIENLTGGSGADAFLFSGAGTISGALDGGGGSNTLAGPNKDETWTISANNQGSLTGVVASFVNIQSLTGGSGQDIFIFANGATMSGLINGGGGNNWLDYAAFGSSLVVNLATGTDSAAGGGVANFTNVIGSAVGGDHLTGKGSGVLVSHGTGNFLVAGSGPSLLIAGYGKNFLVGAAANDILINGYTTWDNSIKDLQAILTSWQAAPSYATAVTTLRAKLTVGVTVFLAPSKSIIVGPRFGRRTTLYESTLVGNGGQNWFFSSTLTSIVDRQPSEFVN